MKQKPSIRAIPDVVQSLRDIAVLCMRLARECPDVETSHGLEEVGFAVMAQAAELESFSGEAAQGAA